MADSFPHYFYLFAHNGMTCLFILLGMTVGATVEQRRVHLVFELFDLLRESALGDAQFSGSFREIQCFGYFDEISSEPVGRSSQHRRHLLLQPNPHRNYLRIHEALPGSRYFDEIFQLAQFHDVVVLVWWKQGAKLSIIRDVRHRAWHGMRSVSGGILARWHRQSCPEG